MYIHVYESMYKYKHVCTMFSSVRTDLPYPVQVVRIPDVMANHPVLDDMESDIAGGLAIMMMS